MLLSAEGAADIKSKLHREDSITITLRLQELISYRYSSCCWVDLFKKPKALSTLSQKSATVAENGETTATVAEFGDSHTFLQ